MILLQEAVGAAYRRSDERAREDLEAQSWPEDRRARRSASSWRLYATNPYQPPTYVYTDPAGRAYTISATGQLQSIKDLNGNTLTVTANGITSSVGNVGVTFLRDP